MPLPDEEPVEELRTRSAAEEMARARPSLPDTGAPDLAADAGAPAGPSRADGLLRAVEASARPVVECLARHGGGGAEAAVAVSFEVSATGRVTRAEVGAPGGSPLTACVRRAAEAVRFDPGEPARFRYEYRVRRDAGP